MVGKLLLLIALLLCTVPAKADSVHAYEFDYLSFPEIQALSEKKHPSVEALDKLHNTLNTVLTGGKIEKETRLKKHNLLNDRNFIRVSQWNIERGFNIDVIDQVINKPGEYLEKNLWKDLKDKELNRVKSDMTALQNTDIFILNEVDFGLQRTNYENIAEKFAKIIGGEYSFSTEFLEVDHKLLACHTGSIFHNSPVCHFDKLYHKQNYKGLHGNAIISKFPITESRIVRLPACYDWYDAEKKEHSIIEKARRSSSKSTINEDIVSEVRRGSRVALISDIELPNKETITAVSVHLENRTDPKCRERQMEVLLGSLKKIDNPIVLGGDLNNFEKSAEPTSLARIIGKRVKDPILVGKTVVNYFNPYGLVTAIGSNVTGLFLKHTDPTAPGIPVIVSNKARKLFKIIEDFRFKDGLAFDFSDDDELSFNGKDDMLSNSNQRDSRGFVETFQFKRSFGIAKYKIDWLFIKPEKIPGCDDDEDDLDDINWKCKRYFPAFGRTLKDLNHSYKYGKISDHTPTSVQLVF